jgi:hypothetical protein
MCWRRCAMFIITTREERRKCFVRASVRVSTCDRQTLAMQNRAMREYPAVAAGMIVVQVQMAPKVDSLYVSRCNRLQCQESAPDSEPS